MSKLIIPTAIALCVLVFSLQSCSRDETPPSPSNPASTTPGDNYVVADGSMWTNDTFLFTNYHYGAWDPNTLETAIWNRDTLAAQLTLCYLSTTLNSTGTDTIDSNGPSISLNLNGIIYAQPHVICNVTRYDAVGGLIEGTHSGYWVAANPPWDTIQVTGVFSVPRQQ